jgi:hypothetical protein
MDLALDEEAAGSKSATPASVICQHIEDRVI